MATNTFQGAPTGWGGSSNQNTTTPAASGGGSGGGGGGSYGGPLPQSTPPDTMDAIKPSGTPNVATPSPYVVDISGATASNAGIDASNKIEQDYQKQLDAQNQSIEAQGSQSFLQKLLGSESPSEARDRAQGQSGFDNQQYFIDQARRNAEIGKLEKDYAAKKAERDNAINKIKDNAGGLFGNAVNDEVARLERNYAVELNQISSDINTTASISELARGNYQEAQNFVEKAVDAATADLKFNVQMYQTFSQINQDAISRLDKKYQDALDNSYRQAKFDYEKAQDAAKARISAKVGLGNGASEVDTLASALTSGQITISQVPSKLRAQVLAAQKNVPGGKEQTQSLHAGFFRFGAKRELNSVGIDKEERRKVSKLLEQGFTIDDIVGSAEDLSPEQEAALRKYID